MSDRSAVHGSALPRLLLLGLVWGATFPISRLGVAAGANPFLLVALDFAVAAAVMAPVATLTRSPWPGGGRLAVSAGLGALLIGGINLPLFWGERFATGGAASVVYATSPMVSLGVVALLRTGERIDRTAVGALALGLAGVLVLSLSAGGASVRSVWGIAAFGLGALCQGVGAVALGRIRPEGEGHWGETFQFVGGGAASLAVLAAVAPSLAIGPSLPVVASVLYVGAVSMAFGYALFFALVHRHGAVGANQVTYLNPVVALGLGVAVFGEPFAAAEGAGLALILLALFLLHRPRARPAGSVPPIDGPRAPPRGEPRSLS